MKVSVYCCVFNHEKYIRDALEGFVNQITNFDYEVFVHDDASTDFSAQIIKEYAEKYPKIIKPIFQKENQYSKNTLIFEDVLFPLMAGDYIAVCEGDDYWIDNNKLQKQVDFLDSNLEYSACVHNSYVLNVRTNEKKIMFKQEEHDICLLDVIKGGSACYQTASLMYRRQYAQNRPDFYYNAVKNNFGDYPLSIYLALNNNIKFLNCISSVYRVGTSSSWTAMNIRDPHKNALYYKNAATMLKEVDKYSNYKYTAEIKKVILNHKFKELYFDGKYKELRRGDYRTIYKMQSKSYRLKTYVKQYFGRLYDIYRKQKYKNI